MAEGNDEREFSLDVVPVYFRIGSIGAGIGVGCGVGIGFGQPLPVDAIPGAGQALAGMSSGLGQLGSWVTGAGAGARQAVHRLGIKRLDAGFGCGVGIGYGFGAGLFLKPSAADRLVLGAHNSFASLVHFAQSRLQSLGVQLPLPAGGVQPPPNQSPPAFLPAAPNPSSSITPPLPHPLATFYAQPSAVAPALPPAGPVLTAPSAHPPGQAQPLSLSLPALLSAASPLQPSGATAGALHRYSSPPSRPTGLPQPLPAMPGGQGQGHANENTSHGGVPGFGDVAGPATGPQAGGAVWEATPEELRALLRHEREIARLRAQNRALRQAVCKLDRRLPICREPSDGGD